MLDPRVFSVDPNCRSAKIGPGPFGRSPGMSLRSGSSTAVSVEHEVATCQWLSSLQGKRDAPTLRGLCLSSRVFYREVVFHCPFLFRKTHSRPRLSQDRNIRLPSIIVLAVLKHIFDVVLWPPLSPGCPGTVRTVMFFLRRSLVWGQFRPESLLFSNFLCSPKRS